MDLLQVERISVEEVDVLLLEIGLYDLPLQQALERVQQLESAEHGHGVVEGLRDDARQPPLQLVDLAPERVEVLVEGLGVDVHDVVLGVHEDLDRSQEIGVRLSDGVGKDLALGSADLDAPVPAEL